MPTGVSSRCIVRPSSITDYYRIVNGDISFGSTTTTNGQVYANGNIDHAGKASGDLFAEGQVTGRRNLTNGARRTTATRTRRSAPRSRRRSSSRASSPRSSTSRPPPSSGGKYLYDNRPGRMGAHLPGRTERSRRKSCKKSGGNDVAAVTPTNCSATATYTVPRTARSTHPRPSSSRPGQRTRNDRVEHQHRHRAATSATSRPGRTCSASSPQRTCTSASTYRPI